MYEFGQKTNGKFEFISARMLFREAAGGMPPGNIFGHTKNMVCRSKADVARGQEAS